MQRTPYVWSHDLICKPPPPVPVTPLGPGHRALDFAPAMQHSEDAITRFHCGWPQGGRAWGWETRPGGSHDGILLGRPLCSAPLHQGHLSSHLCGQLILRECGHTRARTHVLWHGEGGDPQAKNSGSAWSSHVGRLLSLHVCPVTSSSINKGVFLLWIL